MNIINDRSENEIKASEMTDKALLLDIAVGDKAAFALLMNRHLNSVINFVMRYFPQKTDAEDIAQETFIKLWCKAPVWQEKGISVKAWLFKVAYNQCIDRFRQQKHELIAEVDLTTVDETAFVDRLLNVKSDLAIQKKAMGALPERQRSAIMLCAVKGYSNIEAATVMGISVIALESLLARGRRKLKATYQKAINTPQPLQSGMVNDLSQ